MNRKKRIIVMGISLASAFIIGGCTLSYLGRNSLNDPVVNAENTVATSTETAKTSKETPKKKTSVTETEKSEEKKEEKKEGSQPREVRTEENKNTLETTVAGAEKNVSEELVSIKEEADRSFREAQQRQEEIAKQNEEKMKQIKAQQEEYNRQLEAKSAEYKAAIEEHNAEVEAYNKRMSNYYYNNNPVELIDSVNINPGHIYYDANGDLYATCYVSNGLNRPVYNITAQYIELRDNDNNLIACDENIPLGNGGSIGAHSYNTWTFVFSGDKIINKNADLTKTILCKSRTYYQF